MEIKKNCSTFIHQRFYAISQNIDNQIGMENDNIQLSLQYDMQEVSIGNTLFEQMKQGKISYKYLEALRYKASRLSQFPDEQYKKIFEEYAYGKAKTPEEAEALLSSILDRKSNILQNIEQLSNEIYNEWSKNRNAQKVYSVLDSAVQATEGKTRTGKINEQAQIIKSIEQSKMKNQELPKDIDRQS